MPRPPSWIVSFVLTPLLAACRLDAADTPPQVDAGAEARCGDGLHDPAQGERCDTGGDSESCDLDCTLPECGDGHANPLFAPPGTGWPEQCDAAGDSPSCDADCTEPTCGDGHHNAVAGEECDDGNGDNSDLCLDGRGGACKLAFCGDGYLRTRGFFLEQCDHGSANSDTEPGACRTNCKLPSCGDGVTDMTEQCDGGGCPSPQSCGTDCTCR